MKTAVIGFPRIGKDRELKCVGQVATNKEL